MSFMIANEQFVILKHIKDGLDLSGGKWVISDHQTILWKNQPRAIKICDKYLRPLLTSFSSGIL